MSYFADDDPTQPPDPDRRRRVMALWLAVGGSMAVILAVWVMVLPWQLGSILGSSRMSSSRWAVVRPAQADAGFMDTLKQVGANLDRLTAQQETGSAEASADANVPPEVKEFINTLKDLPNANSAPQPASDVNAAPAEPQTDASQTNQ